MVRKILGSLILIISGLIFMQYKGWISFTPKGKEVLKSTLKNSIQTSKKMVNTLIEISEDP